MPAFVVSYIMSRPIDVNASEFKVLTEILFWINARRQFMRDPVPPVEEVGVTIKQGYMARHIGMPQATFSLHVKALEVRGVLRREDTRVFFILKPLFRLKPPKIG